MPSSANHSDGLGPGPAYFAETRWSKILLAGQGTSKESLKAQEELCATYWHPIYSFLRRKGHSPHDAEDLTQQFFVRILGSNVFSRADRSKGRFRGFLLGSLKHFLADEARKAATQKRRGDICMDRLDFSRAEERYSLEPDPGLTPEQVYDRRWAATLLDLAFQRLREDFAAAEQLDRFEVLKRFLSEEAASGDYQVPARQLRITTKGVSMAVQRLRQRYRQLVRMAVVDTLADAGDVDRELHELFD
jgi:RNA polymerase sigma factor (sigma-70 family)